MIACLAFGKFREDFLTGLYQRIQDYDNNEKNGSNDAKAGGDVSFSKFGSTADETLTATQTLPGGLITRSQMDGADEVTEGNNRLDSSCSFLHMLRMLHHIEIISKGLNIFLC